MFRVPADRFDDEVEFIGAVDFARYAVGHVGPDELGFWRSHRADGALDLSFFPTGRWVAGFRIKIVFAGEGEKARQEADQPAVMLGDRGRQVVTNDLTGDATKRGKRMHVATDESLESLAVGEFQIEHAAVRLHQAYLVVFRIARDLAAVIFCAAPALAAGSLHTACAG